MIATKIPQQIQDLRAALLANGYEVKVVDNGFVALQLSRDFRPHLILAEVELPKIDGHHLYREIKAQSATQHIPFFLLSKHRSVEERVHSMNLGVDDYINIPFDVNELLLRFEIVLKEIARFESTAASVSKGFAGKLSDMNVLEVLQTLHIAKKSAIIKIQNDDREGLIFFKDGEFIDASLEQLDAPSALFRMITWAEGTFRVELRAVDQPRIVQNATEEIIQKGLLFKDRWEQLSRMLPPLPAPVKIGANLEKQKFTEEEKEILSHITADARLIDLVERSRFNDLKALQIAAGLFTRGALVEKPAAEVQENGKPVNGRSNHHHANLANLIVNFLEQKVGSPNNGHAERRRSERRRMERRMRGRRWSDLSAQQNRVYLNQSELLMIREKLLEKRSQEEDDNFGMLY